VWFRLVFIVLPYAIVFGCGTTRWSDTKRTATEQVLLSDAMDRAVSQLDFRALAGKKVYLDPAFIKGATDSEYLVSTMRQHMLASGCILRDKKDDADYIVEVRTGAIGTDRHELLFGVPATELPSMLPLTGVPRAVPEMPFLKKTEQRGVARIAVFAYNSRTGRPVWQSGAIPVESTAKDLWVLGAGPFQRGTIYEGTKFAGDELNIPLIDPMSSEDGKKSFSVADEAYFSEPVEPEAQMADTTTPDAPVVKEKEPATPKTAKQTVAEDTVKKPPETPAVSPAEHLEVLEEETGGSNDDAAK